MTRHETARRAARAIVDAAAHPGDSGRAIAARAAAETAGVAGEPIFMCCCAWCGRWRGGGGWVALEPGAVGRTLAEVGAGVWYRYGLRTETTHGMCPICARRESLWGWPPAGHPAGGYRTPTGDQR